MSETMNEVPSESAASINFDQVDMMIMNMFDRAMLMSTFAIELKRKHLFFGKRRYEKEVDKFLKRNTDIILLGLEVQQEQMRTENEKRLKDNPRTEEDDVLDNLFNDTDDTDYSNYVEMYRQKTISIMQMYKDLLMEVKNKNFTY